MDDGVDDGAQFASEEDGYDSRRRFLRAETVIISGRRDRSAQHILVFVNAFDKGSQKEEEPGVLPRC